MADNPFIGTLSVTGNVGIGTEPLSNTQLYIRSSTEQSQMLVENSSGMLAKLAVDNDGVAIGTDTGTSLPFSLQTNGTTRISISNSGSVNISEPLTVQGTLFVSGNTTIGTDAIPATLEVKDTIQSKNAALTGSLTVQKDLMVAGTVGIGTVAPPSAQLDVNGTIKATSFQGDGSMLDGVVKKTGDTITGSLTIEDLLTVTANVGIGVVNPTQKLEISGRLRVIEGTQSTFGGHVYLSKQDGSPGSGQWHINIAPNNSLNFVESGIADYRLVIKPGGNVGIGTPEPVIGLDVRGNNGWIGSGDSSQSQGGWRLGRWPDYPPNQWVYLVRADSTKYQDLAIGALWAGGASRFGTADDLAEMTPTRVDDYLEPGDVVVIDTPNDDRVLLAKSCKAYDAKVAGVISDVSTAGLIIGGSHPQDVDRNDLKPLALAGRVLTKVSAENGFINVGDFLTTASTPGHAMKATTPGYTLGKALQSFGRNETNEAKGKIWVLVNLGWLGGLTNSQTE